MSAKQYILKDIFSDGDEVEIPEGDATSILGAYDFLCSVSGIEDLYSLVEISYSDFEKFIFDTCLTLFVHGDVSSGEPLEMIQGRVRDGANQKLLSLANAYRALCDQSPQRLRSANLQADNIVEGFLTVKSKAFDECFEFRIFDLLRNMITHHSLPVTEIGSLSSVVFLDQTDFKNSPRVSRWTLELAVSKSALLDTRKGRQKTLAEINELPHESLDLKVIVRGFISALFHSRKRFHELLADPLSSSESRFLNAYKKFSDNKEREAKFLELYERIGDREARLCPIKLSFAGLVRKQMAKASGLSSVDEKYPSIEITNRPLVYQGGNDKLWRR